MDNCVDLGNRRLRGGRWCWEALEDFVWRRNWQHNGGGTGWVLVDQENLNGTS